MKTLTDPEIRRGYDDIVGCKKRTLEWYFGTLVGAVTSAASVAQTKPCVEDFFFLNLEHCQRYESTMMPGIMSASELSNNMQIRRVCESGRNLFATKCRHSSYKHILVYVWYPTHTHYNTCRHSVSSIG